MIMYEYVYMWDKKTGTAKTIDFISVNGEPTRMIIEDFEPEDLGWK